MSRFIAIAKEIFSNRSNFPSQFTIIKQPTKLKEQIVFEEGRENQRKNLLFVTLHIMVHPYSYSTALRSVLLSLLREKKDMFFFLDEILVGKIGRQIIIDDSSTNL